MVEVNLYLFGKPEWEMDLEKATADDFKLLGESLRERLIKVSEIVTKLEKNGWERSAGLYDIMFYKKLKVDEAKNELKKLEINEDDVDIEDFDEEDEEDEIEEKDNEENFAESKWVKKTN